MDEQEESLKRFAQLASKAFLFIGFAFLCLWKLPGLITALNKSVEEIKPENFLSENGKLKELDNVGDN